MATMLPITNFFLTRKHKQSKNIDKRITIINIILTLGDYYNQICSSLCILSTRIHIISDNSELNTDYKNIYIHTYIYIIYC